MHRYKKSENNKTENNKTENNKTENNKRPVFVLASASPRRLEICRNLGLEPKVMAVDCLELASGSPEEIVCLNAENKAKAAGKQIGAGYLILGADTIVVKEGRILGKPRNKEEAREMLELLSGSWHRVYTGMSLLYGGKDPQTNFSFTEVKFAPLKREEINWYLESKEPFDKAGAYGIQGKGGLFIEEIRGDYNTVVGLCPRLLGELMEALNYDIKEYLK